jgi:meiotically up-regulated gene 157 (Mug157) protein
MGKTPTSGLYDGFIYANEADGFATRLFMDDANVPSLMSLSYLGIHKPQDEIYQRTRKYLMSENNPCILRSKPLLKDTASARIRAKTAMLADVESFLASTDQ